MVMPCKGENVRPLIHDSWGRSASQGISASLHCAPISEHISEIEYLRQCNIDLMNAARPSFAFMERFLSGADAMMVLADREGVLLDAIGDNSTLRSGRDIHLASGGNWNEKVVGTNGIGTALATGKPVFVHAAEHFCSGIKSWTCAGAPIRDQLDGEIIGIVDLSGDRSIFKPHNTVLVAAAAREIENVLAQQKEEERARLLEAFIASAPVYMRNDGVIILDLHGRVIYTNNLPLDRFPDSCNSEFKLGRGARLLKLPLVRKDDDLAGALPAFLHDLCDVSPLKVAGQIQGAVLVFNRRRRMTWSASRRSGSSIAPDPASFIVGESPALRSAIDMALRVSAADKTVPVLIEGETGVGKELFVRLVHSGAESKAETPFVAMNCGAITRDLFGSELFGHVAGAFTGASREGKAGVFELANNGTLCLDEIGEMPLDMQPFLLRVLEDGVVKRLGDTRSRNVKVRLLASTNRDLNDEVKAGRFRRDLYHRIGAVSIKIPPLRERAGDVAFLLEHFCHLAEERGSRQLRFSDDAMNALLAYSWPGNVRELKNLVGRLYVLAPGPIVDLVDLPDCMIATEPSNPVKGQPSAPTPGAMDDNGDELTILRDALASEAGNLSRVALRLGIARPTLYRRLAKYGLRRRIS
jgi:transcriptional regulator of acetoin/glycerol metabolism